MDVTDFLQLHLANSNAVDSLWNIYITLHLALIGALYAFEKLQHLSRKEYAVFAVAYLAYSYINARAKWEAYRLLAAIEEKTQELVIAEDSTSSFSMYYAELDYGGREYVMLIIHICSAFFLAWIAREKYRNYEKAKSD